MTYKLKHPADIIEIEDNRFLSDASYIEFVIRRLLNNYENKIFNHLDEPKYWCHWIKSRPKSLLGIGKLLYRLFPFNNNVIFAKASPKDRLLSQIQLTFAPKKTLEYDNESDISSRNEEIIGLKDFVEILNKFFKQIEERIDELLKEADENTLNEIYDDVIPGEFNFENDEIGTQLITSRYIIPRVFLKYDLSVDQLFVLAENTYCPDCRFIKVLCDNIDTSRENHLKLYHDYFIGYLERNLLAKFNKNYIWNSQNYNMIKTIQSDSYYDMMHDHEIGLDMTFGWFFFIGNYKKKDIEEALEIVKESLKSNFREKNYIDQFLDTFISALCFLDDDIREYCCDLYKDYFPDYYLTTNIPDCEHSYNYIYELSRNELIEFLNAYYMSENDCISGGVLLEKENETITLMAIEKVDLEKDNLQDLLNEFELLNNK